MISNDWVLILQLMLYFAGLVNISTNIDIFEFDVPNDSFVELNWEKCYGDNIDYDYLCDKIRTIWVNK
jgi:hypothetical protein